MIPLVLSLLSLAYIGYSTWLYFRVENPFGAVIEGALDGGASKAHPLPGKQLVNGLHGRSPSSGPATDANDLSRTNPFSEPPALLPRFGLSSIADRRLLVCPAPVLAKGVAGNQSSVAGNGATNNTEARESTETLKLTRIQSATLAAGHSLPAGKERGV